MSTADPVAAEAIPSESAGEKAGAGQRVHRSKLLLAASIESAGIRSAVRIRDLSETGALLEGPAFPALDTILTLRRMEVEIGARVVWLAPPKCGVEFQGGISIAEWISGKPGPATFGQPRVDAIQADVRTGTPAPPAADATPAVTAAAPRDLLAGVEERIAAELAYVQRLLAAISAELVNDPIVVLRHNLVLQNFDLASQILGHLATIITDDDPLAAIEGIGMEELRTRLLRKGIF